MHGVKRVFSEAGFWLAIALVIGAILRCYTLGFEPIWLDEAVSWADAKWSIVTLWTRLVDDHPPLYYSLLHFVLRIGDSPALLRLPSAFAGCLAIVCSYWLGKRLQGRWIGAAAALLVAVSLPQIEYSQEARSYALLSVAAVLMVLCFSRLFETRETTPAQAATWSGLYAVSATTALYLHHIAAFAVAFAGVFGTILVLRARTALLTKAWIGANTAIVLAWAWWLPFIMHDLVRHVPSLQWLPPPGLAAFLVGLQAVYGEEAIIDGLQAVYVQGQAIFRFPVAQIALCAAGLIGAWVSWRKRSIVGMLCAALALGIPPAEIVESWVGQPVFMPRTVVWLGPLFLVLVALGLSALLPRRLFAASVAVLCAIQLPGVADYLSTPHKAAWPDLTRMLAARLCQDDAVLFVHSYFMLPFDYYLRERPASVHFGGVDDYLSTESTEIARQTTIAVAAAPRVWVVSVPLATNPQLDADIVSALGSYALAERFPMRGLLLRLYEKPHDGACRRAVNED